MNSRRLPRDKFERAYRDALLKLLARPEVGLRVRPPEAVEIDLLYWTDLIPKPPATPTRGPPVRLGTRLLSKLDLPKLADLFALEAFWQRWLRRRVQILDALGEYNPRLEAPTPLGRALRPLFIQTLLYMSEAHATVHEHQTAAPTLRAQVQARLSKLLCPSTSLVIGHSLGSAIAYEALRRNPHQVDTLVTIGAPLGMRRMVYEPLGAALGDSAPYAWPNVAHWENVYAAKDVLFVPETDLSTLFQGRIGNLQVDHGSIRQPDLTHRLQNYLQHVAVGQVIARAWERALTQRPSGPQAARDTHVAESHI